MSHSSFNSQISAQNARGVKTPKSLIVNMSDLFNWESCPNCEGKTKRIEALNEYIARDIEKMAKTEIKLATIRILQDTSDTFYRKVNQYKKQKTLLKLLDADYLRRKDEILKVMGKIEMSVPKSQHGQFSLSVNDGRELSPAEMEETDTE